MIAGARAAPARARHHLLAGARRRPVVLGADQDQGRQRARSRRCRAAGGSPDRTRPRSGNPACRPCCAARGRTVHSAATAAVGPAEQRDAVRRHESLLLQPVPRGVRVGDPLAAGAQAALPALHCGAEPARARSCPGTAPRSRPPPAARPSRHSGARSADFGSARPSQLCSATIAGNGPLPSGR